VHWHLFVLVSYTVSFWLRARDKADHTVSISVQVKVSVS